MKIALNNETDELEVVITPEELEKLAGEVFYSCETGEPMFMEGPASEKMMQEIMEGLATCDFFRSYACNNACPNEAIKQLNEQGHKLPELKCSDCSENTGECGDCIFEGSELCPKNSEGRYLL